MAPIFAGGVHGRDAGSIGVPGLNGFVGEYLILIGSFLSARWWVVIAATGVILAALYLLWAYQRVFHGEPDEENSGFAELKLREGALLLPFIGRDRLHRGLSEADARPHRAVGRRVDRARRGARRLRVAAAGSVAEAEPAEPSRRRGG